MRRRRRPRARKVLLFPHRPCQGRHVQLFVRQHVRPLEAPSHLWSALYLQHLVLIVVRRVRAHICTCPVKFVLCYVLYCDRTFVRLDILGVFFYVVLLYAI